MTRTIGIGLIGTGWMARAHTRALRNVGTMLDTPVDVRLISLAGRNPDRTADTARRWGFAEATTDWRELVDHPEVDFVANLAANDIHAAPSVAALELGKHVLCEKPLAVEPEEIRAMVDAAASSQAVAACGYNYRFVPAVRVLRDLVRDGRLGTLRHVTLGYEQDWAGSAQARAGWRFDDAKGGSGVYDHSHILDLLRWIVGEPERVSGTVFTLDGDGLRRARIGLDPEDAFHTMVDLDSGQTAFLHSSRVATGRKGRQFIEIVGSAGAAVWDMEDMNHLRVHFEQDAPSGVAGFRKVLVTEDTHPFMRHWYAPGHGVGWDDTVAHQWLSVITAALGLDDAIPTDFATFADGARAVAFGDAIRESARLGAPVDVA